MKLSIIIVSFNTRQLLKQCLDSVIVSLNYSSMINSTEIIVVDNASTDGSPELVRERFKRVKVVRNKVNSGFARANNQAIKIAKGDYILLLNSDTRIVPDTCEILIKEADNHQDAGVIGCRLINTDGTVQPSVGFTPDLLKVIFWMLFLDDLPILRTSIKPYHMEDKSYYDLSHYVGWVSGACLMVRREALKKSGLMDESIFMYVEEVEWCQRIMKEGYKVYYTHKTSVYHHKGSSGEGRGSGIIEEFRGLQYFYSRHKSPFQGRMLMLVLKFGALLRILFFGIILGQSRKRILYAKAFSVVR